MPRAIFFTLVNPIFCIALATFALGIWYPKKAALDKPTILAEMAGSLLTIFSNLSTETRSLLVILNISWATTGTVGSLAIFWTNSRRDSFIFLSIMSIFLLTRLCYYNIL